MLANNSGAYVHYAAGRYPGLVGHLYSPGNDRIPYPWLPYAIDNGAFTGFNEAGFRSLLEKAATVWDHAPLWVLCPDQLADRDATLRLWDQWVPELQPMGWPLAFAVQDGMTTADIPGEADLVFIGGSTSWKEETLPLWPRHFERCHLARVNHWRRLWRALKAGYESCDGTGWLRRGAKRSSPQWVILEDFFQRMADGRGEPHAWQLGFDHTPDPTQ